MVTRRPAETPSERLTLARAFNPRANSIGFLRWLLAFTVIFSHAGPLAGFYGGHDLGTQLSSEQSLGGVAVEGFFFFSGFLIAGSRMRTGMIRFLWRRCLRILPAFWLALLLTSGLIAPLAWRRLHGTFDGYLSSPVESPLTYVWHNLALVLHQRGIAGLGDTIPFGLFGHDWNGSAWTLVYEFGGYLLVGVLGLFGILGHRKVASGVALFIIGVNTLTWMGLAPARVLPWFSDFHIAMLLAPFAVGILFSLWADQIPIDGRLALFGFIVAAVTYSEGGWNVFGQYGLLYALMWFAIRATPLQNWERFGDFSYGIYIFAWPVMQLTAYFGLHERGWLAYHLVIVVVVHVLAFFSWHLVEKPAISLKDWNPSHLVDALRGRLRWRRGLQLVPLVAVVAVTATVATAGALAAPEKGREEAQALHADQRRQEQATCRPAYGGAATRNTWADPASRASSEQYFKAHAAKDSPMFERGRRGWVFLGDPYQQELSQAVGRAQLSPGQVSAWVDYLRTMRDQARRAGSDFYVVVAPAKWEIYRSKLPAWAESLQGPSSLDLLLKRAPNLPIVDIRSALRRASHTPETATYSPLNSHWTPYGGAVAWNAFARCLSVSTKGALAAQLPDFTGTTAVQDANEFAAFGVPTPPTPVWTSPTFATQLPSVRATKTDGTTPVPGDAGLDTLDLPAFTSAPAAPVDKTLLMLRDSTGTAFGRWADVSFRRTVQVAHTFTGHNDALDVAAELKTYHPDVTVYLITERSLILGAPTTKESE